MKYPSVTQILSPFSNFSGIRPEVLAHAAERGTRVHLACHAIAQGLGTWGCDIQPEDEPYIESFKKWLEIVQPEFIATEIELIDETLGYCGHPDAIIRMPHQEKLTLVDWKTPAQVSLTWHPQISAYAHMARLAGYDVGSGMAVRLRNAGTKAIATDVKIDGQPWNAFQCALGAFKYFKYTGRK